MKIALITANIGGIDDVLSIPKQDISYDRFIFTEKNLPFPLPNLDNRTKARYIKTQFHRFLPGYDIYIWLDGRVEVISGKFISEFVKKIKEVDFVTTLHSERKDIFDELEYILWNMNKGNHYLISRYGHQNLRAELEFYQKNNMPKTFPLFASGMFAIVNNTRTNKVCDEWWETCIRYSNFDQAALSFLLWKHRLKFNTFNYENDFFKVLKHVPQNPY